MSTVTHLPRPAGYQSLVAAEIRAWMGRQGVNQTQLAEALGITQSQMSKRLRGTVSLTIDELEAIARRLDCEVADFLPSRRPHPTAPVGGMQNTLRPKPEGDRYAIRDSNPEPAVLRSAA